MKITQFTTLILGWLVTRMPVRLFVEKNTMSGFMSRWYRTNRVYKFQPEEKIKLKYPTTCGYGIRPEGVIKGYKTEPDGEEFYIIEMTSDADGDFIRYVKYGWLPPNVERKTRLETHFKWNIEYQFEMVTMTKDGSRWKWSDVFTVPIALGFMIGMGMGFLLLLVAGDSNVTERQLWSFSGTIALVVTIIFSLVNVYRQKKGYATLTIDDFGP
jgi:hypothetical protein